MTYFGVNYFLGGMHSYAGQVELDRTLVILLIGVIVSIVVIVLGCEV